MRSNNFKTKSEQDAAAKTKRHSGNTSTKSSFLRTLFSLGISVLLLSTAFGQSNQYSKNSADQTLRSSGRVNPSSLGMEMDIPLGSYTGRGIKLPLGLNYSSKLWRYQHDRTEYPNNGNTINYVLARFSEDSASGWSSSLSQAYIEYVGKFYRFDGYGRQLAEIFGPNAPSPPGDLYLRRVIAHLPDGSTHELRAEDAPIATNPTGSAPPASAWEGAFYSSDGSGVKYVQDTNTGLYRLYMADGSYYDFNSTLESKNSIEPYIDVRRANRLSDAHGNYVQFNAPTTQYPNGSWTDQLGRTFPVMIPRETPTIPAGQTISEQTYTLPGMTQGYTLRWKKLKGNTPGESAFTDFYNQELAQYAISANRLFTNWIRIDTCSFNYVNVASSQVSQYFNPVLLTEVVLPNGASYRFSYNKYGEIEQVHYPTGGREELQYAAVASLAEMALPYQQTNRGVVNRKIYESDTDSTADTWTYTAAGSANNFRTSTIAPDGTQTDRFMHRGVPEPSCSLQNSQWAAQNYYGTRWGYDNILAGRVYDERSFSSSGQLMQRTLTKWTATNTSVVLTAVPQRFVQRNARMLSTETVVYDGSAGLSTVSTYEYDTDVDSPGSPLNVIRAKQYAYKVVSAEALTPGEAPPANPVQFPADPAAGATLAKITETVYLNNTSYQARNLIKLPKQSIIRDGQNNIKSKSEIEYDEAFYLESASITNAPGWTNPQTSVRGLPTTSRSWTDIVYNQYVETHIQYDQFGNTRKTWDANQNVSEIRYDDNFSDGVNRYTYAYPTKTISAVPDPNPSQNPDGVPHGSQIAFETTVKYKFETGLPTETTDANGQTTQMQYNDALLRPTKTIAPNGHQTITEYGTPNSSGQLPETQRFVKTRTQIDETKWKDGYAWTDGLGRTIKTQSVDSSGDVFTLTCYDQMGRVEKTSNPFRNVSNPSCAASLEWTTTTYDTAGRTWKVITADGATVETTYGLATTGSQIGTLTTVKDQALKERRSITNALGQLIRIDEPNDSNQLGAIDSPVQPTIYSYDVLNNLVQVQQIGTTAQQCGGAVSYCTQTRTFVYDALTRLKSVTNPESGTTGYVYDSNGNLLTETDARSVTTTYLYDKLNRVKWKGYSDGITPAVNYYYDNLTNAKTRLIKVSSSISTTEYTSLDVMGKVTGHRQTTDGTVYTTSYVYNLSGMLIEETYPSTRVVKNVLSSDGNLSIIQSRKNQNAGFTNYASHFTYTASGAISSFQLGNGRWESTTFNNRLQPIQIALGATQNATNLLKLDYAYGGTNNNGNFQSQTITVPTIGGAQGFVATQVYTHDSLNRIKQATETIPGQTGWQQTFNYDRFGNRIFDEVNTTTLPKNCGGAVCPYDNPSANPANNRLNGYSFDDAGNMTRDAQNRKFIYDGENKQTKVQNVDANGNPISTVGEYFYDGDGKRVKKIAGNEVTIFVYDATGKLVAEYSNQINQTPRVSYLTSDNVGTPRINTDKNGNVISRHDYHPFGEEITRTSYGTDDIRKKFTGYERDAETNLDFAQARTYANRFGRFTTTDPYNVVVEAQKAGSAEEANKLLTRYLSEPQKWNLYVYVENNPLIFIDPDGRERLYTSNGTYLGKVGTSDTIRIVNDREVNNARRALRNPTTQRNQRTLSRIATTGSRGVFESRNEAAAAWGRQYNRTSIRQGREYSSTIYQVNIGGENFITYTEPARGTADGSSPSPAPAGTTPLAYIHSHGQYLSNYRNNEFSTTNGDTQFYDSRNMPGYVTTPNGSLMEYNPDTKTITPMQEDMPSDRRDPDRRNRIN